MPPDREAVIGAGHHCRWRERVTYLYVGRGRQSYPRPIHAELHSPPSVSPASSSAGPPPRVLAAAALLILALHWVAYARFPSISSDEGGWPLAVREWLAGGGASRDYVMAPGYHWLLGVPMWIFGPYHWVTRPVSIVVSLIGLALFYRLSRRLADSNVAFWATLLLGTSYSAVMVARRALIEPFQITLMIALCLCVEHARRSRRRLAWEVAVTLVTALLLLTKSSAIFLLPALVMAAGWPPTREWRSALRLSAALTIGASMAGAVFWRFYRVYPAAFAEGWGTDMRASNITSASHWFSVGRFGLDPQAIEATLAWGGLYEPFMLGLAFAALCMAFVKREQILMALWLVFGAVFQSIQFYVQDNHRVVIVAPLCFLTAWVLSNVAQSTPRSPTTPRVLAWPSLLLAAMVAFGSTRILLAMASVRNADKPAVAWLSARTGPGDNVAAAPYVLMQLRAHPILYFKAFPGSSHVPTLERLTRVGANWIVIDELEWQRKTLESPEARALFDQALTDCCDLAWSAPESPVEVYRVRSRAASSSSLPARP